MSIHMNPDSTKKPDIDPKNADSSAPSPDIHSGETGSKGLQPLNQPANPPSDEQENEQEVVEQWHVANTHAGQRLDLAIGERMAQSRQQVKTLLQQGAVRLNGRVVSQSRKGYLLSAGSQIQVTLPNAKGQWRVIPQPELPLSVLAQGNGYLVINKPAGVPVHPLEPDERNTLLNAIVARFPEVQNIGESGLRSGVVHRLDVETSGVLIVATEQNRWQQLRTAFARHTTHKRYTAIVKGHPSAEGLHRAHLVISQHKPARVKVLPDSNGDSSRLCDLSWRVIKKLPNASVLDITLGTGFLHQIRVMMASLGHEIAGDNVYGQSRWKQPASRLMLHAHALHIGSIHTTCELPDDMQAYIDRLTKV